MKSRSLLNLALCAVLALSLSACGRMQVKEIQAASADEAFSFIRVSSIINGQKTSGLNFCSLDFDHEDKDKNEDIRFRSDDNHDWLVLKTPPGNIELKDMMCLQYRVIYNKETRYPLKNRPRFEAKPGVNYAGDLTVEFFPDKFNGTDVAGILFSPSIQVVDVVADDQRARFTIKDAFEEAKAQFLEKYPRKDAYNFHKSLLTFPAATGDGKAEKAE